MANSPLDVGQISNLPVFASAVIRLIELAATYLLHSTLFLLVGWALLPVLLWLFGKRRPDEQECPAYAPRLTERVWKLAAVLALVTAPLSVLTGWSRPAWEWSLAEQPLRDEAVSAVDDVSDARPLAESVTALTEAEPQRLELSLPAGELPFELSSIEAEGRTVAELRAEAARQSRFESDEQSLGEGLLAGNSADIAADQSTMAQPSNKPTFVGPIIVEPTAAVMPLVETSTDAAQQPDTARPVSSRLAWLGSVLIAWIVCSLGRLLAKAISLHRRLARCQPATGELSKSLNKLSGRGRSIRLLQAASPTEEHLNLTCFSEPLEPARVAGSDQREGPEVRDSGPSLRSAQATLQAKEEPLTLTLSPPRRGARGQEKQEPITEPFACGLFHWTIVLPAGIEQRLSPSEMRALLAHEVAHLVRRDPWWLWLGEVLCTCLAFQPLNFLARRRWQSAGELLCDDWAVERHVAATSLASCLTKLAEWRLDRRAALMGLTAVGRAGALTQRIEWLLRNGRASEPKRPRARLIATLMTFSLGLLVGLYSPRLTLIVPAEASASHAASNDETALTDSGLADSSDGDDALAARLWNDIELDLHHTLIELARLESHLATDPDPEVASLARRLRVRATSLKERVAP